MCVLYLAVYTLYLSTWIHGYAFCTVHNATFCHSVCLRFLLNCISPLTCRYMGTAQCIEYTAHIHKHTVAYAYTASVRIRIHTYAINNNFWGDFSCRSVQFISYFGHLCTTHTVSFVFFEPNATTSSTVDLPFMFNLYHFIPCLTCGRCMRYKMKMRISSWKGNVMATKKNELAQCTECSEVNTKF